MSRRNVVDLLYIDNTNLLRVDKLKDKGSGGGFLNAASVTATLKDTDGAEVSGQSWPVALTYVAASDGRYEAQIASTVVIVDGTRYIAEISITDAGTGLVGKVHYKVTARPRTE